MVSAFLIAIALILLSAFLVQTHFHKWAELRSADLDPQRVDFGRRQFRRRLMASLLIGLAGVACSVSPWMVDPTLGRFWWYWVGMLMVVGLLVVFALLDFWDTLRYFRWVQRSLLAKRDERLAIRRSDGRD